VLAAVLAIGHATYIQGAFVALKHLNLEEHLQPISDLSNYKVEEGDIDPRGWTVVGNDGNRIGTVDDLIVDTRAMKVRYLVVDFDRTSGAADDDTALISADDVDLRHDRREVFARRFAAHQRDSGSDIGAYAYQRRAGSGEEQTLTRSEEELHVGKREVSRGEARIGKHVETERVSEPVTRRREEVVVERRPVEAGARGDASLTEDEVRIPLMEEEVVVEKRPVVKEELVVGKRVVEERDTVETELRREEFDIDTDASGVSRDRSGRRDDR
jgi:uncharacterized protein (TIGR02271 family)